MTKNLIIIGGGFAGVTLAQRLEKKLPDEIRPILISEENFLLFSPLLSEVVGASIMPGHCVAPIRQLLGKTEFLRARVTAVDTEAKQVSFEGGRRGELEYHQLVLACGVQARLSMIPGMAEHAFPLKTLGDALELRNRVLYQLERAELEPDPERRRLLTSFTVVGGGPSGIEVAGALDDLLCAASRYYPAVRREDCRVSLVEAASGLAAGFPDSLADFAERHMRKRGIDVRLNAQVAKVEESAVELGSGDPITAGTIICTIGAAPYEFLEGLPVPKEKGLVRTEADLSVTGAEGLWAIGDCASVPNADTDGPAPPTAQFAVREARQLADNLLLRLAGDTPRPFAYRSRAALATIGHRRALAHLWGLNSHGFMAWLLWRAVYLAKVPTLLRRFQIFFEWSWQALFPRDITQFHYVPYRLASGERFRERDEDQHTDSHGQ